MTETGSQTTTKCRRCGRILRSVKAVAEGMGATCARRAATEARVAAIYTPEQVDKARDLFGKRFIALPNAMYGTWENAIYNYRHPSEAEKAQMRLNALELP